MKHRVFAIQEFALMDEDLIRTKSPLNQLNQQQIVPKNSPHRPAEPTSQSSQSTYPKACITRLTNQNLASPRKSIKPRIITASSRKPLGYIQSVPPMCAGETIAASFRAQRPA